MINTFSNKNTKTLHIIQAPPPRSVFRAIRSQPNICRIYDFSKVEGQLGAVFAINRIVIGMELFDSAETLKKLFPKLMNSYGLDALDRERGPQSGKEAVCASGDVDAFLKRILEALKGEFDAIGEGKAVRLPGKNLTGAALVAENHVVHLSAFSVE